MAISGFNGKLPKLADSTFVHESAVLIGDVTLEEDVSVWPGTVLRSDVQSLTVGRGTNIQDGCILHVSHDCEYAPGGFPLIIGEGVTIGHRAVVHACRIGDNCLIGIGAIIMDGAELGDYVMLGAGALVPPGKKLDSGCLYIGAPAKKKRVLLDTEKTFLEYSSRHYIQLKNQYLNQ